MTGRLGIDFGTSNTVLAVWDEARQEGHPIHLEDYGQWSQFGPERVSTVPSLIHYGADRRIWIGDQVIQRGLKDSPNTLRWMKRYINHRTPICIHAGGRVLPRHGWREFSDHLLFMRPGWDLQMKNSPSAYQWSLRTYENWLSSIAENAGPAVRHRRAVGGPIGLALASNRQRVPDLCFAAVHCMLDHRMESKKTPCEASVAGAWKSAKTSAAPPLTSGFSKRF